MKNSNPIIAKQLFQTSKERLWKAITELDQMKQWYFDTIPDFKPEVGFETRFNVHSNGRDFMHIWKITEVIPLKKIAYKWTFEGYEVDSSVSFEIAENGEKSLLILTCYGVESFPDNVPEFTRESCQAGWDYFIKESLPDYLSIVP